MGDRFSGSGVEGGVQGVRAKDTTTVNMRTGEVQMTHGAFKVRGEGVQTPVDSDSAEGGVGNGEAAVWSVIIAARSGEDVVGELRVGFGRSEERCVKGGGGRKR